MAPPYGSSSSLHRIGQNPVSVATRPSSRTSVSRRRRRRASGRPPQRGFVGFLFILVLVACAVLVLREYTFSLQSPVRVHFQWPLVIARRIPSAASTQAQADQFGHRLSAWQQYACDKFGAECRIALAIQRAENPRGACEIYHYNSDGTLDWGYFQINTVHLKRAGLNLRDLLDCRANIDFAYQLYLERGFAPWSTYNNGAYRQFLRDH